jgi:hypothetical protein
LEVYQTAKMGAKNNIAGMGPQADVPNDSA